MDKTSNILTDQLKLIAAMQLSKPEMLPAALLKQLNDLDKHINGCNQMAKMLDEKEPDIAELQKQLRNALVCCRVLAQGQSHILQALLVYMVSGAHKTDLNKLALKLGADPSMIFGEILRNKMGK